MDRLQELEMIRQRMNADMISGALPGFQKSQPTTLEDWIIYKRLSKTDAQGGAYFTDVNYQGVKRNGWEPAEHMERLFELSVVYHRMDDPCEKAGLLAFISALLDYWAEYDFQCPNWWFNEIKLPWEMASVMQLMGDELGDKQKEDAMKVIRRGSIHHMDVARVESMTGANLLWFAMITMRYALAFRDADALAHASERASKEIVISREGMQTDGSFYQHGNQLYSGGYGSEFTSQTAMFIYFLRGTSFQMSEDKLSLFLLHVLDGQRWMIHKDAMDYCCTGRNYVRKDFRRLSIETYAMSLERLSHVEEMPRRDEICQMYQSICEKKPGLSGAKFFPVAQYLTAHIGDLYVSFRGNNGKQIAAEIVNEEGLLGYNMSYGTHTTIMRSGDEYDNISAIWDYSKIPGTTAPSQTDEDFLAMDDWTNRYVRAQGSGAQLGNKAICFEAYDRGIRAQVACLASDESVVLLGCNISDRAGRPLYTTVQQAKHKGDYRIEENAVICDGIRYQNLDPSCSLVPSIQVQEGSWHRNSHFTEEEKASDSVFILMLDRKENHYAYAISEEEKGDPGVTVIRNDSQVQAAAFQDGSIMAVFYAPTTFIWNGKEYSGNPGQCCFF